ncbi:MAG: hypothetical protein ABWY11_00610 [Umezawaea sp.]
MLVLAAGIVVVRPFQPAVELTPASPTAFDVAPSTTTPERPSEEPPPPPPPTEPLDVTLTPSQYVVVLDGGHWYNHALSLTATISVTNTGGSTGGAPLEVSVALAPNLMRTRDSRGDRWNCREVENGLVCSNPDTVAPGESWPDLAVDITAAEGCRGTIDVITAGPGAVEEGVAVNMDTST